MVEGLEFGLVVEEFGLMVEEFELMVEGLNYQLERVLPVSLSNSFTSQIKKLESQRRETSSWSQSETLYPQKGDDSDHSSFNTECLLCARHCLALES